MYNKKSLFITFEGIEGSGKSYQSRKLFRKISKMNFPVIFTREPGGSKSAEKIRKVILTGPKNKFTKITDTLLYIAARNEHMVSTIIPAILNKKIIVCDRFLDSTLAYQVFGKGVDRNFVNILHKKILGNTKPDLTFILKIKIAKAFQRIKKRKKLNRYDKFSKKFYEKVQRGFIKIAKNDKKRYTIIDTSKDTLVAERLIYKKFIDAIDK